MIMKKIYISLLFFFFTNLNLSAAEVGSKHEYGLSFLGSYDYEEPKLMHLRSGSQAADDELENIGFLYNYKNAFIADSYLNEFEFDASYQFLTQTYWSNGTGTMKDIDTEIYNLRALYGVQLSEKFQPRFPKRCPKAWSHFTMTAFAKLVIIANSDSASFPIKS